MKRLLRIIVGILMLPVLFLLSGWIWLFDKRNESFCWDYIWYLVSGDWDKLPD